MTSDPAAIEILSRIEDLLRELVAERRRPKRKRLARPPVDSGNVSDERLAAARALLHRRGVML